MVHFAIALWLLLTSNDNNIQIIQFLFLCFWQLTLFQLGSKHFELGVKLQTFYPQLSFTSLQFIHLLRTPLCGCHAFRLKNGSFCIVLWLSFSIVHSFSTLVVTHYIFQTTNNMPDHVTCQKQKWANREISLITSHFDNRYYIHIYMYAITRWNRDWIYIPFSRTAAVKYGQDKNMIIWSVLW